MNSRRLVTLGLLFFFISFVLGVGALYYRSALAQSSRTVRLSVNEPVTWIFERPTSPRIYYNISCSSSGSFRVIMRFLDANRRDTGLLNVEGGPMATVNGEKLLDCPSYGMTLNLVKGNITTCVVELSYYSADIQILSLLLVAQLITSLIAVSLAILWFSKKVAEGSRDTTGAGGYEAP